ncbi:MAG: hypothetical protein E4H36_13600 [Spirochaetales bacterium]|nr:MAG: hypothetical protein E4H36_13600 [Spirochaetales bacterium]
MAELIPYKCPDCGSGLEIDSSASRTICSYCGKTVEVDREHYGPADYSSTLNKTLSRAPADPGTHEEQEAFRHLRKKNVLSLHLILMEKTINLPCGRVSDSDMDQVGYFAGLERLNLSSTKITDRGLEKIRGLVNLIDLNISNTGITDGGLSCLAGMSGLKKLNVERTAVTEQGLLKLIPLQQLTWVCVYQQKYGNFKRAARAKIGTIPVTWQMKVLPLFKAGGVRMFSHAVEMHLDGNGVTDSDLKYLEELRNLERLYLSYNLIRGEGLVHLAGLRNLKHLALNSNPLDDSALPHLTKFRNLEILYLFHTDISDDGAKKLETDLPGTTVVHVRGYDPAFRPKGAAR